MKRLYARLVLRVIGSTYLPCCSQTSAHDRINSRLVCMSLKTPSEPPR